jgi:hypothetical protein
MPRPLKQLGVGQLEELFARSKTDLNVLKHLADELQFRQVPRAVALLTEVKAEMLRASPAGTATESQATAMVVSPSASLEKYDQWERPPDVLAISPQATKIPQPAEMVGSISASPTAVGPQPRTMPTMSVEDACKLLGVTAGAVWESVEKARRQLVQLSYPGRIATMAIIKRDQTIDAARRANAAYAVLSRLRTGIN